MHYPKRSLGQNFLIDHNIVRKILSLASITSRDAILEIGPGKGILTSALIASGARVVALEKDHQLACELVEQFIGMSMVSIYDADALLIDYSQVISRPYKLVANLPYNIATALLTKVMQSGHTPELLVVMVQKEVAEKICARPPHASVMSNIMQVWGAVSIAHIVSPTCFRPRPRVDSAVIVIEPFVQPLLQHSQIGAYIQLIHSGFAKKRKRLLSNLAEAFSLKKEVLEDIFLKLGLALTIRAEEVTISQWSKLLDKLK